MMIEIKLLERKYHKIFLKKQSFLIELKFQLKE